MSIPFSWAAAAVLAAALLDIGANLLLARSCGFRRRGAGLAALGMAGLAFTALSYAVRSMDLATAYALWGGFGILGTCLGGRFFFGQRLKPSAWIGMLLLIGGMSLLHYTA